MDNKEEKIIWEGNPSQLDNLFLFVFWGILSFLVFPLIIIFWVWLSTKMTKTELSTQRLIIRTGVLNKVVDEVELYRVKDYRIERPFLLNIFGLGNVQLVTSDRLNEVVTIRAVTDPEGLRNKIRDIVEVRRSEKGVREMDI